MPVKKNQSSSKKHSKNNSKKHSKNNSKKHSKTPAALPQRYINGNGRACICHPPERWIKLFNQNRQRWMINENNVQYITHGLYEPRKNIGMPNEIVFQRVDGKVCVCRNWKSEKPNVVQQLITALVGRPAPSSSRPRRIEHLFEKQRHSKHLANT